MKVYELTIRIASAYEDISQDITNDEMAKAIHDYIAGRFPDSFEPTDFAVEVPADAKVVLDTADANAAERGRIYMPSEMVVYDEA